MGAMIRYVNENNDFFAPNEDDGTLVPGHNWCSGDASIGEADEFNTNILKDQSHNLLISYFAGDMSLFHCPGGQMHGDVSRFGSATERESCASDQNLFNEQRHRHDLSRFRNNRSRIQSNP